jgi:hypothetical protein
MQRMHYRDFFGSVLIGMRFFGAGYCEGGEGTLGESRGRVVDLVNVIYLHVC